MKKTKRLLALAVVLIVAVSVALCMFVSASAYNMADYARPVETDTYIYKTLQYDYKWTSNQYKAYYSFKCEADGPLSIWMRVSNNVSPNIVLYDSDGNEVAVDSVTTETGSHRIRKDSLVLFSDYVELTPSSLFGYYDGTINYTVKKGTYYLYYEDYCESYIELDENSCATFELMVMPTKKKEVVKLSCFSLTLSKGDKISLGAAITAKGEVTWTSSKKSVATVSSKGRITAKKAGTTTITAKCGSSVVKIRIIVED